MSTESNTEARQSAVRDNCPNAMFLEGIRVPALDRACYDNPDPGSGQVVAQTPNAKTDDLDAAVRSCQQALDGPWKKLQPKARGQLLLKISQLIRQRVVLLAQVESIDTGKPLREAEVSVQRAADYFEYYAGAVDKYHGETIPLGNHKICFTLLEPIGVTGHIVPWNVPISMTARGLAPALACGNTAVIKPAEETPMTAVLLAELMIEAGLPAGVCNVVTGIGAEVGIALTQHPDVAHITFTGSVETGKRVMASAASHVASVVLELGGKSPLVIMADADLDIVVPDTIKAMFSNAGQICSSAARIIVAREIHDELVERLARAAESMTIGYGFNNPNIGSLISLNHRHNIDQHIQSAKARKHEVLCGGHSVSVEGFEGGAYYAPTLFDNVPNDDDLSQQEVFGPVSCIQASDSLEQSIALANASHFGLAAGIHTANINDAMHFSRSVRAGQVFINEYHNAGDTVPFGGVGDSGIGREKGLAAMANYSESKAITITTR